MLDLRDSSWPILFSNPAMEKALNVKTEDLVGRNLEKSGKHCYM
ncbi:hypothetical protein AK812_SmicGene45084, partial [Symbiodinium microadriaticum]